jgi:predicted peptidase
MILFLHGAGERGDNIEQVKKHGPAKMAAEGKDFDFIILSPQCPPDNWWPSLTDELNAVNSSLSNQLDRVDTDLFNEMNAVNSSLYNQLNVVNSHLADQLTNGFQT